MKRALLIAGGTVGGLGAVLAITPPQISSSSSSVALGSGSAPAGVSGATQATTAAATTTAKVPASTTATKSANATATKSATAKATASATVSTSASASASATPTASPTATKTTAPTTKNVTGTFTGDAINVGYGIVQVQITVNNGKITDAQAVQAPSGRNDRFTQMSVPVLRQKTLAAQGSNITGVSGASYTSYGWYKSLVSALSKAGL
jgi:uncharacterized protein with FMN-binding domain